MVGHSSVLASTPEVLVSPIPRTEEASLCLEAPAAAFDAAELRTYAISMTNLMARLAPADEVSLSQPLLAPSSSKVLYIRHESFADLDPLEVALRGLAEPKLRSDW